MWRKHSLIVCCALALAGAARAGDNVIAACSITPEIYVRHEAPASFAKSNSLVRKPESLQSAEGRVVVIEGRVLDSKCLPVAGAVIKIWQLNSKGYDNGDHSAKTDKLRRYDAGFVGTGTTTTDNLGNYRFLTIIPGVANSKSSPNVKFMVEHHDFLPFTTLMFFADVRVGKERRSYVDDPALVHFPDTLKGLLAAKPIKAGTYRFDITLGGEQVYKKY
jgi:protocatechuate 3,4-dioxygenase beta subunit